MRSLLRKFVIAAAASVTVFGMTTTLPEIAQARGWHGGGHWAGGGRWTGRSYWGGGRGASGYWRGSRWAGGYWRAGPWRAGNWGWGGAGWGFATGLTVAAPYYVGYYSNCSPYVYGAACGFAPSYGSSYPVLYRW